MVQIIFFFSLQVTQRAVWPTDLRNSDSSEHIAQIERPEVENFDAITTLAQIQTPPIFWMNNFYWRKLDFNEA